jgi:prophage regulatory protein
MKGHLSTEEFFTGGRSVMRGNGMNILLRMEDLKTILGLCKSSIYLKVKRGLLPPPVQIGERAVAWPSREIEMITAAQISGRPEGVIKALVCQLLSDRNAI